jgi:hypothetical protein
MQCSSIRRHSGALPVEPKWDAFRGDALFLGFLSRCSFTVPGLPTTHRRKTAIRKYEFQQDWPEVRFWEATVPGARFRSHRSLFRNHLVLKRRPALSLTLAHQWFIKDACTKGFGTVHIGVSPATGSTNLPSWNPAYQMKVLRRGVPERCSFLVVGCLTQRFDAVLPPSNRP